MADNMDDVWADALADQADSGDKAGSGQSDDWAAALSRNESGTKSTPAAGGKAPGIAEFEELGDGAGQQMGAQNLEFLLDIPLEVSVELGRSQMIINRLLQLTQGSVVELDKAAGEPVEIFVNDKLLGKGEVIVVNERFGVRITEIISQADRIKNMG